MKRRASQSTAVVLGMAIFSLAVWLGGPSHSLASGGSSLAVAAFQALGVEKKVGTILGQVGVAYTQRTGEQPLSSTAITQNLGKHGLKSLSSCSQKTECFIKKARKNLPKVSKALFLGIGAIGSRVLIRFVLLDLQKSKVANQVNRSFSDAAAIPKDLPAVMKELFPNYGKMQVVGAPKGALVLVDGRSRGKVPTGVFPAPSGQILKLVVSAPKYKKLTQEVTLAREKVKIVKIKLQSSQKVAVRGIRRPPARPRPPPPPPITSRWWFWAVVGVVVVGGAGAAIGGVLASQDRPISLISLKGVQ